MAKRLRYYFAGFAIGTLLGLLVSYLIGKHNLL
jgi:ABC-type nitrate/sulfonate/bicarbonate transport system permease component